MAGWEPICLADFGPRPGAPFPAPKKKEENIGSHEPKEHMGVRGFWGKGTGMADGRGSTKTLWQS